MDTEQHRFDREFREIVRNYDEAEFYRYEKVLEIEALKASLIDECAEGGEFDRGAARNGLAELNELAAELGHFGRAKITGEVIVELSKENQVPFELKAHEATVCRYDILSLPDNSRHELIYRLSDIVIEDEVLSGFVPVSTAQISPLATDSPA